jgi:hypothetical protein
VDLLLITMYVDSRLCTVSAERKVNEEGAVKADVCVCVYKEYRTRRTVSSWICDLYTVSAERKINEEGAVKADDRRLGCVAVPHEVVNAAYVCASVKRGL